MELKDRLKNLRESRNLTQSELAKKTGITARQIQNYEMGTSRPTITSAKKLAAVFACPLDELLGYDGMLVADAKEKGYVSTLFGRRRALPELSSTNFQVRSGGERMARNTPIQGTAADIIKLAMVRVWRRLRAEGMQSRLILTVHDELIVEAPEAEAARAAEILQHEMEHCVSYSVPLSVEAKIGRNWLQAH